MDFRRYDRVTLVLLSVPKARLSFLVLELTSSLKLARGISQRLSSVLTVGFTSVILKNNHML